MDSKTKRARLIEAAAELFHHKGPQMTSLADIAGKAAIPIGNVYYYFKTKEELMMAVIEKRRDSLRQAFTTLNNAFVDPRQRLTEALTFFRNIKADYTQHGCPLGRLIVELGDDSLEARKAAASVLEEFADWASEQFDALGHGAQAKSHAISMIARIQGAAVMAHGLGNEGIFADEINRLIDWIDNLPNTRIPLGKMARHKVA